MRLVLASASTSRARILRDAGVPFEVRPAHVDEDAVKAFRRGRRQRSLPSSRS